MAHFVFGHANHSKRKKPPKATEVLHRRKRICSRRSSRSRHTCAPTTQKFRATHRFSKDQRTCVNYWHRITKRVSITGREIQRRSFILLLHVLDNVGLVTSTDKVTCDENLMIFLRVLSRLTNRSNEKRWQHSGSTVSDAVHQTLSALAQVRDAYIRTPSSNTPAHITAL